MLNRSENEDPLPTRPGRQVERKPYEGAVQFRKGHTRAMVRIVDISTHGVRLSAVHLLREGDTFWLKLPLLEPQEATVAWTDQFIVGCRFVRPLHPSVLETIVRNR